MQPSFFSEDYQALNGFYINTDRIKYLGFRIRLALEKKQLELF